MQPLVLNVTPLLYVAFDLKRDSPTYVAFGFKRESPADQGCYGTGGFPYIEPVGQMPLYNSWAKTL